MTSGEISARRGHWLRAIGYGVLAEISTIITIVAIVMTYRYVIGRRLTEATYTAFGEQVGAVVGIAGGAVYTFIFARLLMRYVTASFVVHGIVVAIAATALSVGGSIAGHQGVPAAYLWASALKLGAGALAGFLASRSG